MAAPTTEVFLKFGAGGKEGVIYSSLNPSANPFTGLFAAASEVGILAYLAIAVVLVAVGYLLKKHQRQAIAAEHQEVK